MEIYTLNVGQGQFVAIVGASEAIVVDTFVPLEPAHEIINVKGALARILDGKNLVGLMITGFDADHFNEVGLKIVLNKYRPDWLMYPRYFKRTGNADTCFGIIEGYDSRKEIQRHSILLDKNDTRFYRNISKEFTFEVFSPHSYDMNSSNNCSLVVKVTERSSGHSYLVTGDTENDRWESILRIFGRSIASEVLAAPHHGSKNGTTAALVQTCAPHTVLISAGVGNMYGHPHATSIDIYKAHARAHWMTNAGAGQSLRTNTNAIATYKFE